MRKSSLVRKLILVFSGILAVILIIFAIMLSIWFKSYFVNEQNIQLNNQCVSIATEAIQYLNSSENSDFNKLKQTLVFANNVTDADILVADSNGFAYVSSNEKFNEQKIVNVDISDDQMEQLKNGDSLRNIKIKKINPSKEAYVKPIFDGDTFRGEIIMYVSNKNINKSLTYVTSIIWISSMITVVLCSIAISYAAKRLIIEPLDEINTAAGKLAKGDVDEKVQIKSNDEIGQLGQSFNLMAESLQKVDKNRRDFISNVSHELRSPITSIKGFISGILDGVIKKDKEDYYLKIVQDEINRLSRLVNDLLDISAMEAGKFKLSKSEIEINALIKLCLANFEGKIANKNLNVDVILENKHQFVLADRDRIMQVITNIVDNAIKYTDARGYIKVQTKVKTNKVYVSISNSGKQMTEEQIVKIWDRFYKSDKARTNKESTGLGLPIVRLILTQHGEDIWVKNIKEGVEFTFTLTTI